MELCQLQKFVIQNIQNLSLFDIYNKEYLVDGSLEDIPCPQHKFNTNWRFKIWIEEINISL